MGGLERGDAQDRERSLGRFSSSVGVVGVWGGFEEKQRPRRFLFPESILLGREPSVEPLAPEKGIEARAAEFFRQRRNGRHRSSRQTRGQSFRG